MIGSAAQQQSDSRLHRWGYLLVQPAVLETLESEYNFEKRYKCCKRHLAEDTGVWVVVVYRNCPGISQIRPKNVPERGRPLRALASIVSVSRTMYRIHYKAIGTTADYPNLETTTATFRVYAVEGGFVREPGGGTGGRFH